MNIVELQQERDRRKERLDQAYRLADENDKRLSTLHPGSGSYFVALKAKDVVSQAIAEAEKDLQNVSDVINAIDEITRNGQQIEAVDRQTMEAVRYASVVIGIGVDPDHPDSLFGEITRRPRAGNVCATQVASILRDLANQLEANHSHSDKDR